MNVLILTPDRVGSTLLQRTLTVYMLRREFGRPVINLHELTNGLIKYFHTDLNQEVLGKPEGNNWGYYQTLPEIIDLLKSVPHYKTSRLAHYHLQNRKDSLDDQLKFYEYLNNNFFIISCRRQNVFEHALSWGVNAHSKKLNVYSVDEKVSAFTDIYCNGITIPETAFVNYLKRYKYYVEWSDSYFNVQSYFNYETAITDLENYILNLDFMRGHNQNSWKDMFGISFNNWNSIHKVIPDLHILGNTIPFDQKEILTIADEETWNNLAGNDWPEYQQAFNVDLINQLPTTVQTELHQLGMIKEVNIPFQLKQFVNNNIKQYCQATQKIDKLVNDGYLVSRVPIKLQTLKEKQLLIRNFDECLTWYNKWAVDNGYDVITDLTPYFEKEQLFDTKLHVNLLK